MARAVQTSTTRAGITRRGAAAGLTLTAAAAAVAASAQAAHAQAQQNTAQKSLYERLGGVFAIALVVDHFSDAIVKNPIVMAKEPPSWQLNGGRKYSFLEKDHDMPPPDAFVALKAGREIRDYLVKKKWSLKARATASVPAIAAPNRPGGPARGRHP